MSVICQLFSFFSCVLLLHGWWKFLLVDGEEIPKFNLLEGEFEVAMVSGTTQVFSLTASKGCQGCKSGVL